LCCTLTPRTAPLISASLYDRPALSPTAFSTLPSRDTLAIGYPSALPAWGRTLLFELRQFSVMLFSIAAVSENWYARVAHREAAGHTRHTTTGCYVAGIPSS
jgi:hypothetical protein